MLSVYVIFILTMVVATFVKFSLKRKRYSQLVPAVMPNFFNIFGDVSDFLLCKDIHLKIMDKFSKRSKLFQKKGLMCFWFSYTPFIFPLKANAVKEVLKEKKMLDKGWMYEYMKCVVGECLLTSAGKKWKSQKRLLNPCFHTDVLKNFMITFNEESQVLVNSLQEETKEDFTYISNKIARCLLDVASETIFGVTIGAMKDGNVQYLNSLRRVTDIYMARVFTPWMWPDIIFWNIKLGKEFTYHRNKMLEVSRSIIKEKKNRYLNGEKIVIAGKRKAMLDLLLEKHFETQELSEEDIREQVDLFLIAGHETVASSITWTLFLLGHHPDIQAKVHEELDRVFGEDRDRTVAEEELKDLQYLDCVLKESLRIYPGVPIFAREAYENTLINGYPVPKGSACVVFIYGLHRDEDVFPDPEKFDPDRFSPENITKIPDCAYIPFASGARNCIGYKFAEIEMRIIVSWIMRYFTVESLDPKENVKPIMNIGLQSSIPIRIRIRSRSIPKPA